MEVNMALDVAQLLAMSQAELDNLFTNSPAGPIPDGSAEGTAIIATGTVFSKEIAKAINVFAWQGKTFDAQRGVLTNRISVLGFNAIVAEVYTGESWLDHKECIVLDYSKTSIVAHWIRDEIRQIGPNFYLGVIRWYHGTNAFLRAIGNQGQFGTIKDMTPTGAASLPNRRLDTWKVIGAFFDRDERTVKRWEITRGLPVHRVPGAGRANVYANTEELAEWLNGTSVAAEPHSSSNPGALSRVVVAEVETDARDNVGGFSVDRRLGERRSAESTPRSSLNWRLWREARFVAIAVAVLVVAFSIVAAVRRSSFARAARTDAAALRRHTVDPEAEQLYLKGIYYWNKRTPEALNRAVDNFTQAVVREPRYAEAYVGLADCYNLLREYSLMPPDEAYPRAMAAAKRAIAVDDSLSGAHRSLAFADFYWSWDVAGAQREFERALALDPKSAIAHHWYATFLVHLGRSPESLEEI